MNKEQKIFWIIIVTFILISAFALFLSYQYDKYSAWECKSRNTYAQTQYGDMVYISPVYMESCETESYYNFIKRFYFRMF